MEQYSDVESISRRWLLLKLKLSENQAFLYLGLATLHYPLYCHREAILNIFLVLWEVFEHIHDFSFVYILGHFLMALLTFSK